MDLDKQVTGVEGHMEFTNKELRILKNALEEHLFTSGLMRMDKYLDEERELLSRLEDNIGGEEE